MYGTLRWPEQMYFIDLFFFPNWIIAERKKIQHLLHFNATPRNLHTKISFKIETFESSHYIKILWRKNLFACPYILLSNYSLNCTDSVSRGKNCLPFYFQFDSSNFFSWRYELPELYCFLLIFFLLLVD